MMQRLLIFFAILSLSFGSALAMPRHAAAASLHRPGQRITSDDKLVIYPNPSTGIVHLTINNLEGKKVELTVLNVIGSVMYRETLTELNDRYTKTLDLSKFANGLYYVKLESATYNQMSKLVIR
ncbi:T9SS type A sorting domain-containing protein [Hymenobacter sp. ASUV-10]|uniref:T9SS type A sorting domain-containing protein n=1 Tax=Hymenobacter aranciens TaxID=3063996 RepID=A0ABT9BKZ4_9BACT|nr:T9SS type A sorting domain-containing protein [Hymenobacter sp. ASUV-10]MDO7877662.1 T9SS type A sorting domain-containing protein [Hymenobacter sp. ASUV-10]